jgi:EAL and modified HD-GYP domain-containing signal transduction protein
LFILGLFSLIDAMLNIPMTELIPRLHLTERLQEALIKKEGELSPYVEMLELYETGQWERLDILIQDAGIGEGRMAMFYLEAVGWTDRFA